MIWLLLACDGDDGLLGDPISDEGAGEAEAPCGDWSSVEAAGARWTWRYDEAVGYAGSWTVTGAGETTHAGEPAYRVDAAGQAQPSGRDSYTWVEEVFYGCDDEGVRELFRHRVTTDVLSSGETVVSDYSYYYVEPVLLHPLEIAVGDTWTRSDVYDVYDEDGGFVTSYSWVQEIEVLEQAEVEVAAGSFSDALLLSSSSEYGTWGFALAPGVGQLYWEEVSELVSFDL